MRRVLVIDGGGIKGALPAGFLARVEQSIERPIADHFDLIVGTSTGGIIALGLGLGISAEDILSFYRERGPIVFSAAGSTTILRGKFARYAKWAFGPKYSSENLRAELKTVFGERTLGESKTRLVIPAYHRDRRQVYVFKTAHDPRFEVDYKERAVDVALATAAAPLFFPAHKLPAGTQLLDGGIWANNPIMVAVAEAIGVLEWPREQVKVLSLGCTDATTIFPEDPGYLGVGSVGRRVIDLLMQSQSQSSLGMAKVFLGRSRGSDSLIRISPAVPANTFSMDGVKQVAALAGLGDAEARDALPTLRQHFFNELAEPFMPHFGREAPG